MAGYRRLVRRAAAGVAVLFLVAACAQGRETAHVLPPVPTALAFATAATSSIQPQARTWTGPLSTPLPDGPSIGASPAPWLAFCLEDPERHRCWDPPATVALTPQRLQALAAVQTLVNGSVLQAEEAVDAGDHWTLLEPGGTGDCEDLALTKRDLLIRAGWPPGALRMGICYAWSQPLDGDALHAVLTVDTDEGTLVLGNLSDRVTPWHAGECRDWVMRGAGETWRWVEGGVGTPLRPVPAMVRR